MNYTTEKKQDLYKFTLVIILLSIPDVVSYYATNAQTIPLAFVRLSMLSVFLLFFNCSFKNISGYRALLFLCFVLMMLTSVIHITSTMPIMTVFCIGMLMFLGSYQKPIDLVFLNKALSLCAFIFIPIIIFKILQTNIDIEVLLRRGYAWTEIFAYTTLTSLWLPLFFSSVLTKKNIILALFFWLLSLVMGLLSLKRQNIVDSAVAFAIVFFILTKMNDTKLRKRFVFLLIPFIIASIFAFSNGILSDFSNGVSEAMSERFTETTSDLQGFDRFVESKDYFSNETNILDVLLGKGILSAHYALPEEHYFLHIGWTNFIFKGGLFLFFVILLGYKKVFRVFFHPNDYSIDMVFCSMYCVFFFFAFFYINLMGFGLYLPLFFYCLTQINDNRNKKTTNVVA